MNRRNRSGIWEDFSASGNSADAVNAADSTGKKATRTANRASRQAQNSANAAEEETTRQLNQQQASVSANGSGAASTPK